jgi:hypothetical protein
MIGVWIVPRLKTFYVIIGLMTLAVVAVMISGCAQRDDTQDLRRNEVSAYFSQVGEVATNLAALDELLNPVLPENPVWQGRFNSAVDTHRQYVVDFSVLNPPVEVQVMHQSVNLALELCDEALTLYLGSFIETDFLDSTLASAHANRVWRQCSENLTFAVGEAKSILELL